MIPLLRAESSAPDALYVLSPGELRCSETLTATLLTDESGTGSPCEDCRYEFGADRQGVEVVAQDGPSAELRFTDGCDGYYGMLVTVYVLVTTPEAQQWWVDGTVVWVPDDRWDCYYGDADCCWPEDSEWAPPAAETEEQDSAPAGAAEECPPAPEAGGCASLPRRPAASLTSAAVVLFMLRRRASRRRQGDQHPARGV